MASGEESDSAGNGSDLQQPQNNSICLLATAEEGDSANLEKEALSQKLEIMLLKETQEYILKFGKEIQWKKFRKMSKLPQRYTKKYISKYYERLEKKYRSNPNQPPPLDHREALIFELSRSLWEKPTAAAAAPPKRVPLQNPVNFGRLSQFFGDIGVPEILKTDWGLMGEEDAIKYEGRLTELQSKEFALFNEKLALKEEICGMFLEIFTASSGKTSKRKRGAA